MTLRSPIVDVVLLIHVVVGLLGYGSIAMHGLNLRKYRRLGWTAQTERFFDGEFDRTQWFVYGVPVAGIAVLLVLKGATADVSQGWFIGAVLAWVISAGIAGMVVFPTSRQLGASHKVDGIAPAKEAITLKGQIERSDRAVGICVVAYVVAFYLMLFKP
ncbi:MAG: hypothetical protein ACP5PJ_07570 [Acidimicrobiales bacterium]